MSLNIPANGSPYPSPMSCPPGDQEQPQGVVFGSAETLGTIQKQDLVGGGSYPVAGDTLLQQQFLLDAGEGLTGEQQPQQLPLFPQDGVAQLERAVRQLQAGGFASPASGAGPSLVQQVLEAAAQQQLGSVLYSSVTSTDRAQQPEMQPVESSVAKQQQQQQQLQSKLYQCVLFQEGPCSGTPIQQGGAPQAMVQNHTSLFQAPEGLLHGSSQQRDALFQQAEELLSIQTSTFLQQAPSHPSPPQQLFHTPSPLGEVRDPQGVLFQTTLNMLTSSTQSSSEQQPAGPALFLPESQETVQQQQRAQLAFLTPMQTTPSEPPPVSQPPQPQPVPPSMFQSLSPHTPASTLSLSGLLFSGQAQENPPPHETRSGPLLFSQAGVVEATEPMSFQDQSSETGARQVRDGPRQGLLQDQQPMQVGPASEQPVALFMPQAAIFAAQNGLAGLQTSCSSPVQQQPGSLFQTAVSGTLTQPGQAQQTGLFLFGIQKGEHSLCFCHFALETKSCQTIFLK